MGKEQKHQKFYDNVSSKFVRRKNEREGQALNLILLGSTGSGKTTFLDLLMNINNTYSVESLQVYHDDSNEGKKEGHSKTKHSVIYTLGFEGVLINVIDTPGLGDTSGILEDKKHLKDIVTAVNKLVYINAVVILINGKLSKFTQEFEYIMEALYGLFPDEIKNNIILLFTCCEYIEEVNLPYNELPIRVKPFAFENPMALLKNYSEATNPAARERLKQKFLNQRKTSTDTLLSILTYSLSLSYVKSKKFESVYNSIQKLEASINNGKKWMSEIIDLKSQLLRVQNDIEKIAKESQAAENNMLSERIMVLSTEALPKNQHCTLCNQCSKNCHLPCKLNFTLNKDDFRKCYALKDNVKKCNVCSHKFEYHYHSRYCYVETTRAGQLKSLLNIKDMNKIKTEKEDQSLDLQTHILSLNDLLRNEKDQFRKNIEKYSKKCFKNNFDLQIFLQIKMVDKFLTNADMEKHGKEKIQLFSDLKTELEAKLKTVEKLKKKDGKTKSKKKK